MKTILITGGAGFIGSHLCELFLKKGERVICLDNFLTGSIENISHLRKYEQFTFIHHDICNYISIDEKVDAILHFASPASPADYQRLPIQTLKVGSIGTHNALGLAKSKKAAFVLASTSEVYGDPLVHPQPESYWGNVNPVGPRGVYDEAKRFAEAMALAYHRYHGLDVKIARIFNTFGPRMRKDDGRAIPNFINQALEGKPLTVFGSGKQTRSVCYIDDMVLGISALLESDLNEPINLGNSCEMTVLELAQMIIELTNSKSTIDFQDLPVDDPRVRQPDTRKAEKLLAWKPQVRIRDGILKSINYFKTLKTAEPLFHI